MRTRWPGFAAFHSGHVAVVEFISAVWARLRSFAQCVGRPSRGSRSVSLPQDRHDAVASGPSPSSTLVGARIELIIRVMRLEVGLDAGKVYADMPVKVRRPDDGIGARIDHAPGSVTAGERIATV